MPEKQEMGHSPSLPTQASALFSHFFAAIPGYQRGIHKTQSAVRGGGAELC